MQLTEVGLLARYSAMRAARKDAWSSGWPSLLSSLRPSSFTVTAWASMVRSAGRAVSAGGASGSARRRARDNKSERGGSVVLID